MITASASGMMMLTRMMMTRMMMTRMTDLMMMMMMMANWLPVSLRIRVTITQSGCQWRHPVIMLLLVVLVVVGEDYYYASRAVVTQHSHEPDSEARRCRSLGPAARA